MSSSSEKYNKDTYIGYVKMKKGGMKIIQGDKDNKIISVRNKILGHLDQVLSGGKRLKEKNIKKYFKALGGKYIRNNICSSGNNSNCKGGRNISINGAHKLLKLISKKNLPINDALQTFKGSAPELYEKLENKIKGGYKLINYDSDSSHSSHSSHSSRGGITQEEGSSRRRAKEEAERKYPITSMSIDERLAQGKSYDDYYVSNEDFIATEAKRVIDEMRSKVGTEMYINSISLEWIGILSAMIKSDSVKQRTNGWYNLAHLLNAQERSIKDYYTYVNPNLKNENLYHIITQLSKDYLCNGGDLPEPSRKDPSYTFYKNKQDIITSIRYIRNQEKEIDLLPKNELVYNPFPSKRDTNDLNKMERLAKCSSNGGYDDRDYYNTRGGLTPAEEESREKAKIASQSVYVNTWKMANERASLNKSSTEFYVMGEDNDSFCSESQLVFDELSSTILGGSTQVYSYSIASEWFAMISAMINSKLNIPIQKKKAWDYLGRILERISNAVNDYWYHVDPKRQNENLYQIVTELSKNYMCNNGSYLKTPGEDFIISKAKESVIKAIRIMQSKDKFIDDNDKKLYKNELILNPFPLKTQANEFNAALKLAKCSPKGGYDRDYYDNRGGYDDRDYYDNMYGGNFYNQIRISNLRQEILNIKI